MTSTDERIAQERVNKACELISSAYRLHSLDPKETVSQVKVAIGVGVEAQAEDIKEAAYRAA